MNSKIRWQPTFRRGSQAVTIARDLLGAAALGATTAMLLFVGWLVLQFGHAPSVEKLADSAKTLTWIIAGVYGALWLIRALHPTSTNGASGRGQKLNLSPLVRASGNAVLTIIAACAVANAAQGLVNPSWLVVIGYPIATLLALLTSALRTVRVP